MSYPESAPDPQPTQPLPTVAPGRRERRRVSPLAARIAGAALLLAGTGGAVLLTHDGPSAAGPVGGVSSSARPTSVSRPPRSSTTSATARPYPSPSYSGPPSIPVEAKAGDCVGQDSGAGALTTQPCGSRFSLFTVAMTLRSPTDCPAGYVLAHGLSSYFCLTLDVRGGDCADESGLKTDCAAPKAAIRVLAVQPGPKTPKSCVGVPGVTRAMLTGPEPATVACAGPRS